MQRALSPSDLIEILSAKLGCEATEDAVVEALDEQQRYVASVKAETEALRRETAALEQATAFATTFAATTKIARS